MEVVEDANRNLDPQPVQSAPAVHEDTPSAPTQPPGSLTKRSRRPKHDQMVSQDRGGDGEWNKFSRDCTAKKPPPQISSYSKEEAIRRKQREKERRELQEKNAKVVLRKAEEEAARQQQEKERMKAERKAWAQAKFEQRQQKILRAAEERQKREIAYCQLVEKTREQGLLYERLQAHGEELVASQERKRVEEYKSVLAPAKKIGARDILDAEDLHPSLRALQRVQQQHNVQREAEKLPVAFSPKHISTGTSGLSPFSSTIGERRMPGTGKIRADSTRELSPQPRRPVTTLRRPSPVRTHGPSVDRASSPVALPGVEITVHKLPSAPQTVPPRTQLANEHQENMIESTEAAADKVAVEQTVADDTDAGEQGIVSPDSVPAAEEQGDVIPEQEPVAAASQEEGSSTEEAAPAEGSESHSQSGEDAVVPAGDIEEEEHLAQQRADTPKSENLGEQGGEAQQEES